jgi:hypothetical protein
MALPPSNNVCVWPPNYLSNLDYLDVRRRRSGESHGNKIGKNKEDSERTGNETGIMIGQFADVLESVSVDAEPTSYTRPTFAR